MALVIFTCNKLGNRKSNGDAIYSFLYVFHGLSLFQNRALVAIYLNISSFSSVQFSHSVRSDSLLPHESQHTRPPCPSPTPGVYSNSCPSSWWLHPTISSFSSLPPCKCINLNLCFNRPTNSVLIKGYTFGYWKKSFAFSDGVVHDVIQFLIK